MKSGLFETKENRTPHTFIDSTGKMLLVETLQTSHIDRADIPESYNFESLILRTEQYSNTVIVVTADRKVRVIVNAGYPDIADVWGLWNHQLPDWLRNEMKNAHDKEFPKDI